MTRNHQQNNKTNPSCCSKNHHHRTPSSMVKVAALPATVVAAMLMLSGLTPPSSCSSSSLLPCAAAAAERSVPARAVPLSPSSPLGGADDDDDTVDAKRSTHDDDEDVRRKGGSSPIRVTTTRSYKRGKGNCEVCDAFGDELEKAIVEASATADPPQTFRAMATRLLQRFVMFWHPHFFLRRMAKVLYLAASGEVERALVAMGEVTHHSSGADVEGGGRRLEGRSSSSSMTARGEGGGSSSATAATPRFFANSSAFKDSGVAFHKWDKGIALTVETILAAEADGAGAAKGFPWLVGRGAAPSSSSSSSPLSIIPLGAAAQTALILQEESAADVAAAKKKKTKQRGNEESEDAFSSFAYRFAEVQPEMCIAYEATAARYGFNSNTNKAGEGGGGDSFSSSSYALFERPLALGEGDHVYISGTNASPQHPSSSSSSSSDAAVDPLVATALSEMFPLGFVWVIEENPIADEHAHEEGGGEGAASSAALTTGGWFSFITSIFTPPAPTAVVPSRAARRRRIMPISASLNGTSASSASSLYPNVGRCYVPIPTRSGMAKAVALLKADQKRNGNGDNKASPSSSSQRVALRRVGGRANSNTDANEALSVRANSGNGAATVQSSPAYVPVDYLSSLYASEGMAAAGGRGDGFAAPLALVVNEVSGLTGADGPNDMRQAFYTAAVSPANTKEKGESGADADADAKHYQLLAFSRSIVSSMEAVMLALEQVAKVDALVATSREMLSLQAHGGTALSMGGGGAAAPNALFSTASLVSWLGGGGFSSSSSVAQHNPRVLPKEVFTMAMCPLIRPTSVGADGREGSGDDEASEKKAPSHQHMRSTSLRRPSKFWFHSGNAADADAAGDAAAGPLSPFTTTATMGTRKSAVALDQPFTLPKEVAFDACLAYHDDRDGGAAAAATISGGRTSNARADEDAASLRALLNNNRHQHEQMLMGADWSAFEPRVFFIGDRLVGDAQKDDDGWHLVAVAAPPAAMDADAAAVDGDDKMVHLSSYASGFSHEIILTAPSSASSSSLANDKVGGVFAMPEFSADAFAFDYWFLDPSLKKKEEEERRSSSRGGGGRKQSPADGDADGPIVIVENRLVSTQEGMMRTLKSAYAAVTVAKKEGSSSNTASALPQQWLDATSAAHFKQFYEVYFSHSLRLFAECAEGGLRIERNAVGGDAADGRKKRSIKEAEEL